LQQEAFVARCLLRAARVATLATQSEGQPYASLVTPAALPDGSVLRARSTLTESSCGVERALSLCLKRHLCRRADALFADDALC
jgi:hypothetical protein